jgi:NAD(P)-dependent dehydrogenase (short-subunit alcohol dehydrogenase family)
MQVLVTGAHGTVGTALDTHLGDREEYEFTYLDRENDPDHETVVADVSDYEAIRPAFDGQDAVVHLAAYPYTDGTWEQIQRDNVVATNNVLEAAADAGVESVVFGSTHHVVGMYEVENAPGIYYPDADVSIDHTVPHRPDSIYGASKGFNEDMGRYYVENEPAPERFYAIRMNAIRDPEYDHPYGDAEAGVDRGDWERGSEMYEEKVARLKAVWQSRRDCAHLIDCCLQDDSVEFDIFYGVSDNDRRFCEIDRAKEILGYDPQDNGEEWDAPPE